MQRFRSLTFVMLLTFAWAAPSAGDDSIVVSDDGSWCWFQDERALIDGDLLLFTGVTSDGKTTVSSYHLGTGERHTAILNDTTYRPNDHNVGALLVRPDGRYLAVYAGHNTDHNMRARISTRPGDITQWGEEIVANTGDRTTYSNVYRLEAEGRTYNFHRGINWNPNYMISDDDGLTWRYGGRLMAFEGRPYPRYTSDNVRRIHFITTEHHPRNHPNSIYHAYIENGQIHHSDGSRIGPLSTERDAGMKPTDFTRVFAGSPEQVAWTSDIELDDQGHPYIAFSVTRDQIRHGEGGFDQRYHYARFDGERWHEHEIAFAGTRLYPREDEYTGLIALHPRNPNIVYISADVHPATGHPLVDGEPRYEIFRGITDDGGETWQWTAITENSTEDNLRPILVTDGEREVLLWLRGRYTTYTDFQMHVRALIDP